MECTKSNVRISGEWNPFNWLSQTRRNLTSEYLNLNFVTTPKLTPLHSIHFMWKRFLFLAFGSFPFRECVHFQAFSIPIFCSISFFGFKVFNQLGTRWYFQLVENKNCFSWETAKEVVEGLGTGSFVTVNNLAPHSCGFGEVLPGKSFLITYSVWRHV